METPWENPPISVQEAAASLTAVKDSRRRARRVSYPVWFWLATGVGLATIPLYINTWLPSPWEEVISLASMVLAFGTAIGICLRSYHGLRNCGPALTATCLRELPLLLWPTVSYFAVIMVGGFTWDNGLWSAPLAPLVTAAAAFAVWTGLGLAATTFSVIWPARR